MTSLFAALTIAGFSAVMMIVGSCIGFAFGVSVKTEDPNRIATLEQDNEFLRMRNGHLETRCVELHTQIAYERELAQDRNLVDLRPNGPIRQPDAIPSQEDTAIRPRQSQSFYEAPTAPLDIN